MFFPSWRHRGIGVKLSYHNGYQDLDDPISICQHTSHFAGTGRRLVKVRDDTADSDRNRTDEWVGGIKAYQTRNIAMTKNDYQ